MGQYLEFQRSKKDSVSDNSSSASFEAMTSQRAISILNDEYGDQLDEEDLAKAYDVMLDFAHANLFCATGKKPAGDKRLQRSINKIN